MTERATLRQIRHARDQAPTSPTAATRNAYLHAAFYFRDYANEQQAGLRIIYTDDPEPYETAAAQSADIEDNNTIRVSTADHNNPHPLWSRQTNAFFRLHHDVEGHHADHTTRQKKNPHKTATFDTAGEIRAYTHQVRAVNPFDRRAQTTQRVILSETLAQLPENGVFPQQKACLLPFDPLTLPPRHYPTPKPTNPQADALAA